MGNLGQLGVRGLVAVNSWIGIINANLIGSSRTAYKTSRPVLLDGVVNSIGDRIQIPAPTLNVQATTLEWAQGSIINSNYSSHFALQGEGFFVLTDGLKYYLSRDGEFHWDGNGYLVNSSGLRVLSNGQDFIRKGNKDVSDIFDPQGQSQQFDRYGNKSFLIVDVANRQGLRFSRFGSTVFEVDGDLPLRVKNSFEETMDGVTFVYRDPKQIAYVDTPEFPPFVTGPVGAATNFTLDLGGNGIFDYQAFTTLPFNPATTTIDQVVTAITNYATATNTNLTANYDAGSDRLTIENIPEPKVPDPNFGIGNFAIDFGQNGMFTYHSFDPKRVTIQNIVDSINQYALNRGVNVTASYNVGADTFTLTNTTGAGTNNEITFDGVNGSSIAALFQLPVSTASTGGGGNFSTSSVAIDRSPPSINISAEITPNDVATTSLYNLVHPKSEIIFGGPNGTALAQFFRVKGVSSDLAFNSVTGYVGSRLQSSRDIDNSNILSNPNHNLDITPADVTGRFFLDYLNLTDNTLPGLDFSGPPPVYTHDRTNNRIISDGTLNNGYGILAIGQAQRTDAFELVLDYRTTANQLALNFGYDKPEQIDSGGFTFFYNPTNGNVTLALRDPDPNNPPVTLATLPGALPASSGLVGAAHRMAASVTEDGFFEVSIDGSPPVRFSLAGFSQQRSGYLSLSHHAGRLELDNMYADFKGDMNHDSTGGMVAISLPHYSSPEVNAPYQDRERTRIVQSALETSTSSLTEYLPMLSLAQKVFSSISKIISTATNMTDDVNALLR